MVLRFLTVDMIMTLCSAFGFTALSIEPQGSSCASQTPQAHRGTSFQFQTTPYPSNVSGPEALPPAVSGH
jgi:hypothetical protein